MISPQGYNYGEDPKSDNPFWTDDAVNDQLTATASVDDTSGIPSVSVTKQNWNLDFAFKGLKGEQGAKGDKGDTGATGATGKTGSQGPAGPQGPEGPQGPQGPAGKDGSDADISKCVTDVSVVNTNGVYEVKETKNGVETTVGQIEVPEADTSNLLAEVNDAVVENTTSGYDFHTITETENNGTQNDVGSFYIARKQICELQENGFFSMVDQTGNLTNSKLKMPFSQQTYSFMTGNTAPFEYAVTTDTAGNAIVDDATYLIVGTLKGEQEWFTIPVSLVMKTVFNGGQQLAINTSTGELIVMTFSVGSNTDDTVKYILLRTVVDWQTNSTGNWFTKISGCDFTATKIG